MQRTTGNWNTVAFYASPIIKKLLQQITAMLGKSTAGVCMCAHTCGLGLLWQHCQDFLKPLDPGGTLKPAR